MIRPLSCEKKVRYEAQEEALSAMERVMEEGPVYIGGRSIRGLPNVYPCRWDGLHWHWGHSRFRPQEEEGE